MQILILLGWYDGDIEVSVLTMVIVNARSNATGLSFRHTDIGHLEKLPLPALGKLAGPYKTRSRTNFLMARRQPAGGLRPIFRGALLK